MVQHVQNNVDLTNDKPYFGRYQQSSEETHHTIFLLLFFLSSSVQGIKESGLKLWFLGFYASSTTFKAQKHLIKKFFFK